MGKLFFLYFSEFIDTNINLKISFDFNTDFIYFNFCYNRMDGSMTEDSHLNGDEHSETQEGKNLCLFFIVSNFSCNRNVLIIH